MAPASLATKGLIAFSSILLIHAYASSYPLPFIGMLMITRSCYSAHEHSLLTTAPSTAATPSAAPHNTIPTDITLETLLAVSLLCVGIVSSGWELKPISWRKWAGKLEGEEGCVTMYEFLENRTGFLDIRVFL
jgi:hypothetical protein